MNRPPTSLEQLQRWMQSVVMYPGPVSESLATEDVRRHLAVKPGELESVIRRSRLLGADARLEIYVDAYYERLFECLREEFPATRSALGDELFDAAAFGYLRSNPSQSYTLNQLGARFPAYLDAARVHERQVPAGAPATWGLFIVELATFERLLRDIFDGPGSEEAPPLDAAALSGFSAGAWGQVRLQPTPSLRLRRFRHGVQRYWSEVKSGTSPTPPVSTQDTCLAMFRRAFAVGYQELSEAQYLLLGQLAAGQTVETSLRACLRQTGLSLAELELHLPDWFASWASGGYFARLATGSPSA